MYTVGESDTVVELHDFPQQDVGAPLPRITANDTELSLTYNLAEGDTSGPQKVVHVSFDHPRAHMFGPPNDEAINGHPLYQRGLRSYGVYEVLNSSWIKQMEEMNRVHARHSLELFKSLRHLVFTFHDGTFECVAKGYSVAQ